MCDSNLSTVEERLSEKLEVDWMCIFIDNDEYIKWFFKLTKIQLIYIYIYNIYTYLKSPKSHLYYSQKVYVFKKEITNGNNLV